MGLPYIASNQNKENEQKNSFSYYLLWADRILLTQPDNFEGWTVNIARNNMINFNLCHFFFAHFNWCYLVGIYDCSMDLQTGKASLDKIENIEII